jgi:hypothetical protein
MITRSLAEELAFNEIKTVEHIADMSDTTASNYMSGMSLKRKAQDWLARAKKDVSEVTLMAELAKRDKLISTMQAQLDKLVSGQKPKRRRKALEETESDDKLSDTGQRPAEQGSC